MITVAVLLTGSAGVPSLNNVVLTPSSLTLLAPPPWLNNDLLNQGCVWVFGSERGRVIHRVESGIEGSPWSPMRVVPDTDHNKPLKVENAACSCAGVNWPITIGDPDGALK